jgi:hypothetical protein
MAQYKWNSAYEWLESKIDGWSAEELRQAVLDFAQQLGSDAIQDRYQDDMAEDGFFQDLDITSRLRREQCVEILESVAIEFYDDETVETLREAVQANIDDGTIAYSDVEAEVSSDA